jgi:hypothetical protein
MLWIIKDINSDATKYYLDIIERVAVNARQKVKMGKDLQLNRVEFIL